MLVINDSRFVGKYVAVDSDDRVIGYADSRDELARLLEEKGYKPHQYSVLYIPSQLRVRMEYSKIRDVKVPLMNVKLICKDKSLRAIATFGNRDLIDKSLAEVCGILNGGEVVIEIGGLRKEVKVSVYDLSKTDLPIVPGLILSPTNFIVCFYENFFEISG